MEILAIIAARRGSKGIPGKNIVQLGSKPLIAWSILTAQQTKSINRVVVTTDSKEIADVALRYGAEVPFIRPKELSLDDTSGMLPILHAVEWLSVNENYHPDYVINLQPTSPLRTVEDIEKTINILIEKGADSVVSVTPVEQHPYWMKLVDRAGLMTDFVRLEHPITNRQDLPPVYVLNGAIFLAKREMLLRNENWYTDKTFSYVMPKERSIDIDSLWDLRLAEFIMRENSKQ